MKAPRPPLFVTPLFVAPRIYRLRRLRDAARMLPFFGAALILLPMLHSEIGDGTRSTAPDGIYIFALWGLLILAARFLAPGLEDEPPGRDDSRED